MSERWIFVDLDGPVLDVSGRYHQLHRDVVQRFGGWPFPRAVYWDCKRRMVPEMEILIRCGLSEPMAREAEALRKERIESPESLELDVPWPWAGEALTGLEAFGRLALVTLRGHPERVGPQLRLHGLEIFFQRILAGRGDGTPRAKAAMIRSSGIPFGPGSVIVGDTEVDVESGRVLGIRAVALACGIRVPGLLERCGPDVILEDLRGVPGWLEGLP
jgi:phosphoglycolate phosphatase-like HAD superfamily hydrolase